MARELRRMAGACTIRCEKMEGPCSGFLAMYDGVNIFLLHVPCKTETMSELFRHLVNPW